MKPDSFKFQLQAVLTAYYEDIKGVQGASCCPKTKIVKCRFTDLEQCPRTRQTLKMLDEPQRLKQAL